ncbi:MAG TPA: protease inhibitor I42 family protein [Thermotogota bacterium]|nr:protease inhibitor I42 family protein [Thermotogota bacterium]HRW91972.1 protease inhibitor I42 family protein [Thermotogota bacterium]
MKNVCFRRWFLFLAVLLVGGCVLAASQNLPEFGVKLFVNDVPLVPVWDTEQTATVTLHPGDVLRIEIESNATTGYEWELVSEVDERFLKLESNDYFPPNSQLMGAGGWQHLVFSAMDPGVTSVQLEYRRPWDPADTVEGWNLFVHVYVQPVE